MGSERGDAMEKKDQRPSQGLLERFAVLSARFSGSTPAFVLAFAFVLLWLLTGPLFHYSSGWQLVINTGTTIVTFLLVFLIQRSQNKDSKALHLKLNEMIAALEGPSNHLVNIEDLTEKELDTLHRYYQRLAERAREERGVTVSHSLEEADRNHERKALRMRTPNDRTQGR